jgi:predicted esterase
LSFLFCSQSLGDEVCPPVFAQNLERLLRDNGFEVTAFYVDDGHKVTGSAIRDGVRKSAVTFADNYLAKLDQQKRENKDQ